MNNVSAAASDPVSERSQLAFEVRRSFFGGTRARIVPRMVRRMLPKVVLMFVAGVAASVCVPSLAGALPWDIDMYRQQSFRSNEMARGPVPGTVPYGSTPMTLTTEEAGKQLNNPVAMDRDSIWRGRRLYRANCYTCHGMGKERGPVGAFLPVPDFTEDFYKARTDGYIFGVIHNGGAVMPKYGFKFSEKEHWDLVNYVRFLQGKDVPGYPR